MDATLDTRHSAHRLVRERHDRRLTGHYWIRAWAGGRHDEGTTTSDRTSDALMVGWLGTMLRALIVGVFVLVAVGAVSVGFAPSAGACSCASPTDAEALAQADAAFTGSLVDVVADTEGAVFSSSDPERFVFEVETVFKGEVTSRQSVVTPRGGESCGLEISGPGPYLVFAFDDSELTSGAGAGELYSHLCSGTRALAEGDVPINFTSAPPASANDTPSDPGPESATAVEGDGGTTPWVLLAAGGGLIFVVAAAIRARTSSRNEPRT